MKTRRRRPSRGMARQRGLAWMDTLVGLTLIVMLTGVLAATHAQHRKTAKAMGERRDAMRELERHAGQLMDREQVEQTAVTQEPIDEHWVRLSQPISNGEVELMMFIPKLIEPRGEASR